LLKAIVADAKHFDFQNEAPEHLGADPAIWNAIGKPGALDTRTPLMSPIRDFYLTNSIARASVTMAECSRIFVSGADRIAAE
jgi:NADH-quinone oxidoreductase subunit G